MLLQAFPQTPVVIDPVAQMNQALQRLRHQTGANSPDQAEAMLGQLVASAHPLPALQGLSFDGQTLRLKGLSPERLAPEVQARLRAQGYETQTSAEGLSLRHKGQP